MSTTDTMTSLASSPSFGSDGSPLPGRSLPGLRPAVIHSFDCSHPGMIHRMIAMLRERPDSRTLLRACGLVLVCGVTPDAAASGFIHNLSGAWPPAAALSLTLITAVIGSRR